MVDKEDEEEGVVEESLNIKFDNDFGKKIVEQSQSIMEMLRRQYEDQDKRIDRVLRKEQQIMSKLKEDSPEQDWDEAEKELSKRDLEDLIREEGEDVDFEFYFEGKKVDNLSRTIWELIKEKENQQKKTEKSRFQIEQLRVLQEREDDLNKNIRKV